MRWLKPAIRMLVLTLAAASASCIDSREEYWLADDGSGRLEITCSLPATVAPIYGGTAGIRTLISGFLADTPELAASHCEVVTTDSLLRVKINANFDSAMTLQHAAARPSIHKLPAAAAHLVGTIQIGVRGRTVDFTRTISAGQAVPGSSWLAASQLAGHRLLYIMHLPAPATASNATRVEDGGRTLVWDIPLAQSLAAPLVTHFSTQLPIPWTLVSALAPLLVLGGGWAFLRRRKACRPASTPA